ncbi:MAG: nitrogenase component 1 [Methanoregulaceae archaeon]|nr:nitrogenase component 1 [Methanoregulaceae archaeon]MCU0627966.1 nitrogenase component 1 [Methanoregulaceae archaeon]
MRECMNALWPCAMTGAVTCFAGIGGIGTVIHGPSGCYFYPATILHRELHCTFLIEEDIIFGAEERLLDLVRSLQERYRAVAVVNTCTPAIIGEDIRHYLPGEIIMVDSPGFLGNFEDGYLAACRALPVKPDPDVCGVNLDGIQLLDPFCSGNSLEAERILASAGIPVAARFCDCTFDQINPASCSTVQTNPDLASGHGLARGTFLGIDDTEKALKCLEKHYDDVRLDAFERERDIAEHAIETSCEKFLMRHDPPEVALFSGFSYADFAARMLKKYLDASITVIGCRNGIRHSPFRVAEACSLSAVQELIAGDPPDLLLGSSFERMACPTAAFIPFTYPLRGMVRLRARPIIGIQGLAGLMEDVLNACLDHQHARDP